MYSFHKIIHHNTWYLITLITILLAASTNAMYYSQPFYEQFHDLDEEWVKDGKNFYNKKATPEQHKFLTAVTLNNISFVQQSVINVNFRIHNHRTPVFTAVKEGLYEMAKLLIEEKGAFTDGIDEQKNTLLHLAAQSNDIKLVDLVLNYINSDAINKKNHYGNTPLHIAISKNNKEIIKALQDRGALTDISNGQGHTAAYLLTLTNSVITSPTNTTPITVTRNTKQELLIEVFI